MLRYRAVAEADLDTLVEAERRIHAFPWTRGNFADSLAVGHGAWLALEDGEMVGYAVTMPAPDGSANMPPVIVPRKAVGEIQFDGGSCAAR